MSVENNPNGMRFEWRLTSINSDWLNWHNLRGNYKTIFNRYKEYLSVLYNNFVANNIVTHDKENKNFIKVKKFAVKNKKRRYTGSKLKKAVENETNGDIIEKAAVEELEKFQVKKRVIAKVDKVSEMLAQTEKTRRNYM